MIYERSDYSICKRFSRRTRARPQSRLVLTCPESDSSSQSFQPSGYKLVLWDTSGHQHARVQPFRLHSQSGLKYSLCGDRTASISPSVSLYPDRPIKTRFCPRAASGLTGLCGECPCQTKQDKMCTSDEHNQISPHNLMFCVIFLSVRVQSINQFKNLFFFSCKSLNLFCLVERETNLKKFHDKLVKINYCARTRRSCWASAITKLIFMKWI